MRINMRLSRDSIVLTSLISVYFSVFQCGPHLREIDLHLLKAPMQNRLQKVHAPTCNSLVPVYPVVLPNLFESFVRWPATDRQLPSMLHNVKEASDFHIAFRLVDNTQGLAKFIAK